MLFCEAPLPLFVASGRVTGVINARDVGIPSGRHLALLLVLENLEDIAYRRENLAFSS